MLLTVSAPHASVSPHATTVRNTRVADRQRIPPVQQVAAYDSDGVEERGRHADTGTVGERGHGAHHTCSLGTTRTSPPARGGERHARPALPFTSCRSALPSS